MLVYQRVDTLQTNMIQRIGSETIDFPTKYAWFPVIFPLNQSILVGGWPTPLKNTSSSVGMMKFPIYGKVKFMFQTTNQSIELS